jgi:hypothetical protein
MLVYQRVEAGFINFRGEDFKGQATMYISNIISPRGVMNHGSRRIPNLGILGSVSFFFLVKFWLPYVAITTT